MGLSLSFYGQGHSRSFQITPLEERESGSLRVMACAAKHRFGHISLVEFGHLPTFCQDCSMCVVGLLVRLDGFLLGMRRDAH